MGSAARRVLDGLYMAAGYLAAFFLAAIAVSIAAQVVGRYYGLAIDATEISGFCLAAATFLGLAHTLKSGTHIRINLLIRYASGRVRQIIELWCTGFTAAGLAYFTYWTYDLVYYSWLYRQISPGLMAVPFWIPQLGMLLGLLLLTIAMIDEFITILFGCEPSYETNDDVVLPPPVTADAQVHEPPVARSSAKG